MSIWRSSLKCLLLTLSLLVSGCITTLGPVYSKVDQIPDNVGLIYFYRPAALFSGGLSYDIKSGETVITTLKNGGYFPYFAVPGEKEFWAKTEVKSSVTLDVKAGQTYYVKGEVGVGILIARPHLMVVAPEIAEREIAHCYLIPGP